MANYTEIQLPKHQTFARNHNVSPAYTPTEFTHTPPLTPNKVREKMMAACRRMRDDGWWWYDAEQSRKNAPKIKLALGLELIVAFVKTRLFSCFAKGAAHAPHKLD